MDGMIVEMATIKLAQGLGEDDLIAASARFQSEFLAHQPGFLSRELVRTEDGGYADIVRWADMAHAAAIMEKVADSPACQTYFSVMEMDPDNPADGVSHYRVLARYGA